jgi:hypothetical protein
MRITHLLAAVGMVGGMLGAVGISAASAKPIGPNPFPAVSQSVCEDRYGGVFSGGGDDKTCVVTTSSSATYYHGQGHTTHGGWTIDTATVTTYEVVNGVRSAESTGSTTCINPGGKTMTNDWIKPCLPSSYA